MSHTAMVTLGILFVFAMTMLGSSLVFFLKNEVSPRAHALMLGFAAGIMVAASVWSLLVPSIEGARAAFGSLAWLPALLGFLAGGLFGVLLDRAVPHLHLGTRQEEGPRVRMHKATKMFLAVTIHNIPEGLAVGFTFGAAAVAGGEAAHLGALMLAVGIGIQNLPEGAAVALPLHAVTRSRRKAFWWGTASGAVEPVAAVAGYLLSEQMVAWQPWLLALAAGSMIFVVAEDLIPDARHDEHPHLGTWGVMVGFALMMVLDVALG